MDRTTIRAALERVAAVFAARPSQAISADAPALARWRDGLECELTGPHGHRARTALSAALGGAGDAPSPGWYLRAAQASCLATAIVMCAAERDIELCQLEVECGSESDARGALGLQGAVAVAPVRASIRVRIDAPATGQPALRELVEIASRQSPVLAALRDQPAPQWILEFPRP
jgi:uncharacterized OsmC-like protein